VRILVTGGAGFIGSSLTVQLAARHPDWELVAFDNLCRRGSELNLPRLKAAGARFVHGDIREPRDLLAIGPVEAIVECSADPSASAGLDGRTDYVVQTNLLGAYNALELARRDGAQLVFLSTSRVYPVAALNEIALVETETRFELSDEQTLPGVSSAGISEAFPLAGPRTLYGATKLSAELLVEEYTSTYGLRTVVDRFGVVAGPWQMGKVDQGVFTYWLLAHHFGRPLRYIGFGGSGKQVRDLLHVDDLVDLIEDQLIRSEHWAGAKANVGGGRAVSLSLLETTEICRELTGNEVAIGKAAEDRAGDFPVYISDCRHLRTYTDWRPRRDPRTVLAEIRAWIENHESAIASALESGL
jgi:CDP-paratose 2-epimerase